jgi:hypothetical protein
MEKIKKILLTGLIIVFLTATLYFISDIITKTTGNVISDGYSKNQFDDCLKQQDIRLYISSDNLPATLNELKLSNELQYIKIFNCMDNPQICKEENIDSFPTWIINKTKINRDISISGLSQYSGC